MIKRNFRQIPSLLHKGAQFMDQTYQILTDATADLSAEIVEEFGL